MRAATYAEVRAVFPEAELLPLEKYKLEELGNGRYRIMYIDYKNELAKFRSGGTGDFNDIQKCSDSTHTQSI